MSAPLPTLGGVNSCPGTVQQSGAGGPPIYTRVFGNAAPDNSHTTDPDARQLKIVWTSTAASLGNRATISIDGGPEIPLPNNIGTFPFGTLDSSVPLGYTVTFKTNQNNDDGAVLEEF